MFQVCIEWYVSVASSKYVECCWCPDLWCGGWVDKNAGVDVGFMYGRCVGDAGHVIESIHFSMRGPCHLRLSEG